MSHVSKPDETRGVHEPGVDRIFAYLVDIDGKSGCACDKSGDDSELHDDIRYVGRKKDGNGAVVASLVTAQDMVENPPMRFGVTEFDL
jgi:hypothetical protein